MIKYLRIEEEFNTKPELDKKIKELGDNNFEIISYNESINKINNNIKVIILVKQLPETKKLEDTKMIL